MRFIITLLLGLLTSVAAFGEPTTSPTGAPLCFRGMIERTYSTTGFLTANDPDTGVNSTNDWHTLALLDAQTTDVLSNFSDKFSKTTDVSEWTSNDTQAIRIKVTYESPWYITANGSGKQEMAIQYSDTTLDLAYDSSDSRVGYNITFDDNGDYNGGHGTAIFDLPALGKFAIIARQTLQSSASNDARSGFHMTVEQVSTTTRACQ